MSMTSADEMSQSHELTTAEMQARVFSLNFPQTIFKYQPHSLTQEEKHNLLISKNREALAQQLRLMESYTVNVTEDSLDMAPHANPPL